MLKGSEHFYQKVPNCPTLNSRKVGRKNITFKKKISSHGLNTKWLPTKQCVLVDFLPLGFGSLDPHIYTDPNSGSQNLADPTDPHPDHCHKGQGLQSQANGIYTILFPLIDDSRQLSTCFFLIESTEKAIKTLIFKSD